jgi:hypothetical protein
VSAHVLLTGSLYRPPEQRISKAGKPFVTATLKAKAGIRAVVKGVCGERWQDRMLP